MNLSNSDFDFIRKNQGKIPLTALANKFKLNPLEFCKMLRTTGLNPYIKDIEIQYIKDAFESGIPTQKVKETLGVTETQFSQICSRHGFKQLRGIRDITLEDAIKNTKWLIEEELKIDIDDFLPGYIRQDHFVQSGLSDCIRFANIQKKKDSYYKHFSAVAFLVCHTYPEIFKGYQFSHAKQNNYFKGVDGKKVYLLEVAWVIENKMGLKLKDINTYISNNTFLRSKDLSFYGLGYHTFKHLFNSVEEIKNELLKKHGTTDKITSIKTDKLRVKLLEVNMPFLCSMKNCDHKSPQVHHIIPKREKMRLRNYKIDFDTVDNLIFLCPNHHGDAEKVDWKQFLDAPKEKRRELLLDVLNKKELDRCEL